MRVTVLGAGVIGMSCAYYLARAGHEVVVVDRQRGPALETSFANAGGICPGFAGPWAAPGLPFKGHAGCSRATRRSCCGRGSIRTSGAGWRASCELQRRTLRAQQGAHAAHRPPQQGMPRRADRGHAHRLRPRRRRRAAALPHRGGACRGSNPRACSPSSASRTA